MSTDAKIDLMLQIRQHTFHLYSDWNPLSPLTPSASVGDNISPHEAFPAVEGLLHQRQEAIPTVTPNGVTGASGCALREGLRHTPRRRVHRLDLPKEDDARQRQKAACMHLFEIRDLTSR